MCVLIVVNTASFSSVDHGTLSTVLRHFLSPEFSSSLSLSRRHFLSPFPLASVTNEWAVFIYFHLLHFIITWDALIFYSQFFVLSCLASYTICVDTLSFSSKLPSLSTGDSASVMPGMPSMSVSCICLPANSYAFPWSTANSDLPVLTSANSVVEICVL